MLLSKNGFLTQNACDHPELEDGREVWATELRGTREKTVEHI